MLIKIIREITGYHERVFNVIDQLLIR